jgi:UDP-glucuronate 4-epimerase
MLEGEVIEGERILVVGATGMVARPVVSALAQANEVWGAARFRDAAARQRLEGLGVRTVQLDLKEADFSSLPDDFGYVVNMAVGHPPNFDTALAVNAEAVGLLISHVRSARAFLHCSSTGVYQPAGERAVREDDPLGDNHRALLPTYSISKIAAEAVVRTCCRLFELPSVIARLNVPYGNGPCWPAMHLEMILSGQPVEVLPGGPSFYTPIHTDDVVRQVPLLLGAASVPAVTVNWAGPDAVSVQEWCGYLASLVGAKACFSETDKALPGVVADTSRMEELIGPARVRWQDGMRQMAQARCGKGASEVK